MKIVHHGGIHGVTGSCHQLVVDRENSLLVDCGLFQGAETSHDGRSGADRLKIDFDISTVRALLITHCHIDHVGRIPYLLAAGFKGPIVCSEATAALLPLVIEDALKVGFTRDKRIINQFLRLFKGMMKPVRYGDWESITLKPSTGVKVDVNFKPAGHILGSSYIECRTSLAGKQTKVIFSGDLGAPYSPLLPSPKAPYGADVLVLESTYGNREHEGRKFRTKRLRSLIKRCFKDRGTILIPAFSIGRTQELLYELEDIIHHYATEEAAEGIAWEYLDIIVDSPLASRFTDVYKTLKPLWDREARRRLQGKRHPLSFEQLTTVDSHKDHQGMVRTLKRSKRPAIVIAASGMCTGGRITNYLKALIDQPSTDILLVGYQARGTTGAAIQTHGPRHGWVDIEGKRYQIQAGVHTLSGYSAHADQGNLVNFVKRMKVTPKEVRLVHGDEEAKRALKKTLRKAIPGLCVTIP